MATPRRNRRPGEYPSRASTTSSSKGDAIDAIMSTSEDEDETRTAKGRILSSALASRRSILDTNKTQVRDLDSRRQSSCSRSRLRSLTSTPKSRSTRQRQGIAIADNENPPFSSSTNNAASPKKRKRSKDMASDEESTSASPSKRHSSRTQLRAVELDSEFEGGETKEASRSESICPVSVTDRIYRIAQPHLRCRLNNITSSKKVYDFDAKGSQTLAKDLLKRHAASEGKAIAGPLIARAGVEEGRFQTIVLDNVVYKPGDTVLVKAGNDEHRPREKAAEIVNSINEIANEFWFAEIAYFWLDTEDHIIKCHVRWFTHGTRTILRETAGTNELFLIDECDNIAAEAIVAKFRVEFLPNGRIELEGDRGPNRFFYRYLWLPLSATFVQAIDHRNSAHHFQDAHCRICHAKEWNALAEVPRLTGEGNLIVQGETYHLHEFVYVARDNTKSAEVFIFGRIIKFKTHSPTVDRVQIYVQIYDTQAPPDSNTPAPREYDDRLISSSGRTSVYPTESIQGKFFVVDGSEMGEDHLNDWLRTPDHYYTQDTVKTCVSCYRERIKHRMWGYVNMYLSAFDGTSLTFRGTGLALGLDSGPVKTVCSVEHDQSAAMTLRSNQHLSNPASRGQRPPAKGSIDLVYGGPPCQSFSAANRYKKQDDHRHPLTLVLLSLVDHYEPRYVLIENVTGLASYSLSDCEGELNKLGMLKIVFRCLTSMGYQCCFNVLNAGAYGAPQSRKRLIILASRFDCPLLKLPVPTHAFPSRTWSTDLTDGFVLPSLLNRNAPLPPITVDTATSDLPILELRNGGTHHDGGPALQYTLRWNKILPYRFAEPLNRYQKWIRYGSEEVSQHFITWYNEKTLERISNLPRRISANWSYLPLELQGNQWRLNAEKNRYGRINPDGFFPTAMTHVNPDSKHGQVIHPWQKRAITLRERARSQGFPDTFRFMTTDKTAAKMWEQAGNAVPIPLGAALSRQLAEAIAEELHL
ncbi:hypothetical protein FRB97_004784 [Tulasnella sp. 331]|nr:hypothetical protein FRB97_004784 [Tulasnella sp. 331]